MIDFNNKLFLKAGGIFQQSMTLEIKNLETGRECTTPSEISITQINQRVIENTELKK